MPGRFVVAGIYVVSSRRRVVVNAAGGRDPPKAA